MSTSCERPAPSARRETARGSGWSSVVQYVRTSFCRFAVCASMQGLLLRDFVFRQPLLFVVASPQHAGAAFVCEVFAGAYGSCTTIVARLEETDLFIFATKA